MMLNVFGTFCVAWLAIVATVGLVSHMYKRGRRKGDPSPLFILTVNIILTVITIWSIWQ